MTHHRPSHGTSRSPRRAAGAILAAAALGGALAGCSNVDRTVATSAIPVDYHERHPIVLADRPRSLDVFVGTGDRLDYRQRHDLETFAAEYRAQGRGRIRVLVPRGGVDPAAADATLMAVRRGLAAAGVSGAIEVGTYRVGDPRLASVLRLSFPELQAGTARPCGDWPEDLGPGDAAFDISNRPYSNLGCATQQTLAAQVDDPRDLVRPRAEEPGDVYMRTRAIQDLRGGLGAPNGQDPGTNWTQSKLTPIGSGQ
ncbi:pilus assembly protein CpaD [Lichenibacterium minor]|uniref:Pilus assembly protein CpaD n=1 Tax=Lichenibacterium minor TaxID=2316528 RepID=A0A4Q2UFM8_9HYPH|nr:CpaD family pilus assembly protein [Lichenibacterium minor]RYC34037.1 pilus assembly protein CpaD [Lichenibacterium minor]